MKIAIIIRKLNTRGGNQRHVLSLARELAALGHRVTLYTFLYSPADCYHDLLNGLEVVSLDYYPRASRWLFFKENSAARRLAERIDPDTELLNPHDQVCYRVAYYYKKRVKAIPSVWVMHDMPTRLFSLMREEEMNARIHPSFMKTILAKALDWYENRTFINAQDAIVVLDHRDRKWVKTYFGKEATVVRNGIDISSFPFTPHAVSDKTPRMLASGIFFPHRRFEDAIMAVKMLRDEGVQATLSVIGSFSETSCYYQELRALVDANALNPYVTFLGKITEENLRTAYAEHDIFISPNHLQSWGLAVFEAMASGSPVIVSNTAGASEVLTDGKNALIVPAKNPEAIAQAITRLITNPDLYEKLSKEGRAFVEGNISWERCAKDMANVFERTALNKKTR